MLKFSFIRVEEILFSKQLVCEGWSNYRGKLLNTCLKSLGLKLQVFWLTLMNQGYPWGLTSCSFHLPIIHFGEAVCITQPMDKKHFGTCFWIWQAYHNIPSGNIPSSLSKISWKCIICSPRQVLRYYVNSSDWSMNTSSLYQGTLPFSYRLSTLV